MNDRTLRVVIGQLVAKHGLCEVTDRLIECLREQQQLQPDNKHVIEGCISTCERFLDTTFSIQTWK